MAGRETSSVEHAAEVNLPGQLHCDPNGKEHPEAGSVGQGAG